MSFVHDQPEFSALITAVERETGVEAALVEKDYWITHSLWALHETALAIWFKGGTSLSKGFGIIERFSEDLDLMIERGGVTTLPEVTSWASTNKGPTAQRRAFYDALPAAFAIPGVSVELDAQRQDKYARAEDMLAEKGIAALPSADDPALVLDDPEKRASVERAYAKIAPMFWGPRIPPDEACATLREWVGSLCR